MAEPPLDMATFAELQDTAGADFVVELVGTFLEEAPLLLAELRRTRGAGEGTAFERAAHSLKSNANTFGAQALGNLARTLELQGLAVADDAALLALGAEYARVAAALEALCRG